MTQEIYDEATELLEIIEKLTERLNRVQSGVRVIAQAEDESIFIDLPALQGEVELEIETQIDDAQTLFDAL